MILRHSEPLRLPVILTLNRVKGKNLMVLRAGSGEESLYFRKSETLLISFRFFVASLLRMTINFSSLVMAARPVKV